MLRDPEGQAGRPGLSAWRGGKAVEQANNFRFAKSGPTLEPSYCDTMTFTGKSDRAAFNQRAAKRDDIAQRARKRGLFQGPVYEIRETFHERPYWCGSWDLTHTT